MGGGHLSQPNQINKVPGRLPFKNKTIQASSGLSKMFLVFRSTNVTMYALWVKINKFNHCHAFIIQSLAFLIKPDFRTSCKLELFSKTILADFKIFIFFWLFSVTHKSKSKCSFFREAFERKKWLEVGIILGFFHGKGGGCPSPNLFTPKKWEFFRKK